MKKGLRKEIKEKRFAMDLEQKKEADLIIEKNFLDLSAFVDCKSIFIYVSMEDEVNTLDIISKSLELGKKVYVPKVHNETKTMRALRIESLSDLNESGAFGILEPSWEKEELKGAVDIILTPGLAFDKKGGRLGYGGGFYDKFFKIHKESNRVVLSYEYQIVDEIPMEDYDERVNLIITEKNIYDIKL